MNPAAGYYPEIKLFPTINPACAPPPSLVIVPVGEYRIRVDTVCAAPQPNVIFLPVVQ